jgi:hypothetical protein
MLILKDGTLEKPLAEKEKWADAEIILFDTFYQSNTGDKPLAKYEKAMLKTYLLAKTQGAL